MNKKCQIFTPEKHVNLMLDIAGYNQNLYGKKILENSCGEGNILIKIVEKYIEDSLKINLSKQNIKKGLETDIYAFEIDENVAEKCKINLDKIALKYQIKNVKWKLLETDYLFFETDLKFDYIIGNPPYIKYSSIEQDIRTSLRRKFISCKKGKFDYCYPFVEKSLNELSDKGKLVYLIPNSIFKNVFANDLREMLLDDLFEIYDYKSIQIFSNALTSSAIIYINKEVKKDYIHYKDLYDGVTIKLLKQNLVDKWIFSETKSTNNYIKFSDYFTAHISVATLLNKAFVVFDNKVVEKGILMPAASPKNLIKGKKEYIIFPYKLKTDRIVRISPEQFEEKYPIAFKYLSDYKEKLNKRKSDVNCHWYEYGRSQALNLIHQEKLVLSTVVTKEIKVFLTNQETIPYSGIFIVKNKENNDLDLNFAIAVLKSNSFLNYVNKIGINASGGSLRITVKDINDFDISEFIKKEE